MTKNQGQEHEKPCIGDTKGIETHIFFKLTFPVK
jgi:hypothetical protein